MTDAGIPIRDIVAKVKHLEIRARKLVQDSLSSEYHSVFKGRGLEFNEVREYLVGDDIRDIDWNVTARMNEPFVKTYIEERELTVVFAVDISASSLFGSDQSRRERMASIVALLGFAAFFNNDRTALALFTDDLENVVSPRRDYSHILRIVRDTWYFRPKGKRTSLAKSLSSLRRMLKKRAVVFLLSDFLDTGYETELAAFSRKHDLIPICVHDALEERLDRDTDRELFPFLPVLADVEDIETGESRTIDLSSHTYTALDRFRKAWRACFRKYRLDYAEITDRSDAFKTVELLLRRRMHSRIGGAVFADGKLTSAAARHETLVVKDRRGNTGKLSRCAEFLRDGKLVVFPTETVYGLGANALDPAAVRRIFTAKGRPSDNPLIVHLASVDDLPKVASEVPEIARRLFQAFSPGPLTIVLPKNHNIPDVVTAGLPTVGVRIPRHPVARLLIKLAGVPVAAPSANRSGKLSPTDFEMAFHDMEGRVEAVIDGGECDEGLESTVIAVSGNTIRVLRPGSVTEDMIRAALADWQGVGLDGQSATPVDTRPQAPGMKYSHYKPKAEVWLSRTFIAGDITARFPGRKVGILALDSALPNFRDTETLFAQTFPNAKEYARELYRSMAAMDLRGAEVIVAQSIEDRGIGRAIMNRLRKSSEGRTL
jgi:L-threonylcarbamoyladenylate synthase